MIDESNNSRFINNSDLDKKIATLVAKAKLKAEQDKIVKLQVFDSSYFRGKRHFEDDDTQNYLMFLPIYTFKNTFKKLVIAFIFQWENLKDCLKKLLSPMLHLIKVFLCH